MTLDETNSLVIFFNMHLERIWYANQIKIQIPGLAFQSNGEIKSINLNLADRIILDRFICNTNLLSLGIEKWPWELVNLRKNIEFFTGDGAVILWRKIGSINVSTITFPIASDKILVIGNDFFQIWPDFNTVLVLKSRRWLVGKKEQLSQSFDINSISQNRFKGQIKWTRLKNLISN